MKKNLKLLIAVPSKNRYGEKQILRNTFSWLKYSKYDFRIFVEPSEYEKYCEVLGKENVVSIEENDVNLGGSKVYIQKWASKNGYDLIMKCDDDIWNWRDFKNGWYPYFGKTSGIPMEERKRACAEFIFDKAMQDSIELFEKREEVGMVGYLFGQMMFHKPGTKWITYNGRPNGIFMARTNLFAPKRQEEVHQFEDFFTWYSARKLGFVCPIYGLAGFHVDGNYGVNSGGMQDFNRKKMLAKSIRVLNEIWPNEMVYKKDNGIGGFFVTTDTRKIELCKPIPVPKDLI